MKKEGNAWRFDKQLIGGTDGSFAVTMSGKGQGLWNDFNGTGGDMFKLIKLRTGGDFKTVLNEALNFMGGKSHYVLNDTTNVIDIEAYQKRLMEKARLEKAELDKKIEHVKTIAKGTLPIVGTLAEKYLRDHRAINGPLNSDNLCFHPALKNWSNGQTYPALVVLAHNENKELVGVQATFLDPITANKAKMETGNNKLSRGQIGLGSTIHHAITDNSNPTIALAEGLETALSVAEAHPDWEVKLTFGVSNFEKVAIASAEKMLVICADNDGLDSGTARTVQKAVVNLATQGIKALVVEPTKPQDFEKWDFNDALKKDDIESVRADLDKILPEIQQTNKITPEKESISSMNNTQDNSSNKPPKDPENSMKIQSSRTPWQKDFPDVIVHSTLQERNQHPDYQAAKNGDIAAAYRLVTDLLTEDNVQAIKDTLKGEKPIIAGVIAQEKNGINVIPEVFAKVLSHKLGLPIDEELMQTNYVNHTKNSAFHRMAYPATFEGKVEKGKNYFIVDDHVGLGGTLANLKGHIENNGGHVILTSTLTESHNSRYLSPLPKTIQGIKDKHGKDLSDFLKKEVNHDIEELTRAESGQLLKPKGIDEIRERFAQAKEERGTRLRRETSEPQQHQVESLTQAGETSDKEALKNPPHSHSIPEEEPEKTNQENINENLPFSIEDMQPSEQDQEFEAYLKHYQTLLKRAEEEKSLSAVYALNVFSKHLSQHEDLMQYANENYPTTAKRIQIQAKEHQEIIKAILKETKPKRLEAFNNVLKKYQTLQEQWKKNPNDLNEKKLTTFASQIVHAQKFMNFTQYFYPDVAKNIFELERTHKMQQLGITTAHIPKPAKLESIKDILKKDGVESDRANLDKVSFLISEKVPSTIDPLKEYSKLFKKETSHDIERLSLAEASKPLSPKSFDQSQEEFITKQKNNPVELLGETSNLNKNEANISQSSIPENSSFLLVKSEFTQDQIHKYETILNKFHSLQKEEQTSGAINHHAFKMAELPRIMRYIEKQHPKEIASIQEKAKKYVQQKLKLPDDKIMKFDTIIKKYESLQEAQVKNTTNLEKPRNDLETHAFNMSELSRLMKYVEHLYPKHLKNIQSLSRSHQNNQSHDIDR